MLLILLLKKFKFQRGLLIFDNFIKEKNVKNKITLNRIIILFSQYYHTNDLKTSRKQVQCGHKNVLKRFWGKIHQLIDYKYSLKKSRGFIGFIIHKETTIYLRKLDHKLCCMIKRAFFVRLTKKAIRNLKSRKLFIVSNQSTLRTAQQIQHIVKIMVGGTICF